MTEHTPGPWTVRRVVSDTDQRRGYLIEQESQERSFDDTPNLRLIAAAPELLKALKDLVRWDHGSSRDPRAGKSGERMLWGGVISQAQDAITKAEK